MSGKSTGHWRILPRLLLAVLMAMAWLVPVSLDTVSADTGARTLTFHHTHTGQTGTFTYFHDGHYDQQVLDQMNVFLADWRNHKVTHMDPALFDLLWQIYQQVGASQPINIVSSYRSPETNAMLRRTTKGVAENSQHMLGKAMDIFIPGINLEKLREVAMSHQVGGVGYYPTSGSPFVHVDTGNVRAWPRMTRAQLAKLFPDGKTLHLPAQGPPLSQSGRDYAEAQWKQCHEVPCDDRFDVDSAPVTMVASLEAPIPATRPDDLYADEQEDDADVGQPGVLPVETVPVDAPVPLTRTTALASVVSPSTDPGSDPWAAWKAAGAPIPAVKSPRLMLATRGPLDAPSGDDTALAALAALDRKAPTPGFALVGARGDDMVTAYVDAKPDPGAQQALRMIIERETTGALAQPSSAPPVAGQQRFTTAALGSLNGLFDATFRALDGASPDEPVADAVADLALSLQPNPSITQRSVELIPVSFESSSQTLMGEPVSGDGWAITTDEEGYLDKSTELGPLTSRIGLVPAAATIPAYDHFVDTAPTLVAGG